MDDCHSNCVISVLMDILLEAKRKIKDQEAKIQTNVEKKTRLKTSTSNNDDLHFLDVKFYKSFYSDISKFSDELAKKHYHKHGIIENRFPNSYVQIQNENDIDLNFYKRFYADLSNMKEKDLIDHFSKHGKNEGRFPNEKEVKEFVKDSSFDVFKIKETNQEFRDVSYENIVLMFVSKSNYNAKVENKKDLDLNLDLDSDSNSNSELKLKMEEATNDEESDEMKIKKKIVKQQLHNVIEEALEQAVKVPHKLGKDILKRSINASNNVTLSSQSFDFFNKFYTHLTGKAFNTNNIVRKNTKHVIEKYNDDKEIETSYLHLSKFKNTFLPLNVPYYKMPNLDFLTCSFVFVLDFSNLGGGATFFINSIISKYKYKQTFLVLRPFAKMEGERAVVDKEHFDLFINDDYIWQNLKAATVLKFLEEKYSQIEKIFVNHTLNFNKDFLNTILEMKKEKILITHDYFLISSEPRPFIDQIVATKEKVNINCFDTIITQNEINCKYMLPFINEDKKIIVSPLPDFTRFQERIETNNDKIVVALIGQITDGKGRQIVRNILKIIRQKKLGIKFVAFGDLDDEKHDDFFTSCLYRDINHLNELLKIHKPNCILETSLWAESYSYTLSLKMILDLPIFSMAKPFDSVIKNRLTNEAKERHFFFNTLNEALLLILTKSTNRFCTIEPKLYYNKFWENFFITKKDKKVKSEASFGFKNNIKPYLIYFPQFHDFKENDSSFYKGYHDVKNLKHLLENTNENVQDFETPSLKYFGLDDISDYNLTNLNIMQKQIDLLVDYDIAGFSVYFYWFSLNTVTKQRQIMEKVYDRFFDSSLVMKGKKVFFTWANESWTKNPAFNVNKNAIENSFSEDHVNELSALLIKYFCNTNYLKIQNKPVFSIYHPWCFSKKELDFLYTTLEKKCMDNGFHGIHFIKNQQFYEEEKDNFIEDHHHFNYKTCKICKYDSVNKNTILDYKEYIESDVVPCENTGIQTLSFDFDNRARMVLPDRLSHVTVCVNNTEIEKVKMMREIINKYSNKDKSLSVEKILLVNAFNEWGEKMTLEPSNEYGFYNLNLLYNELVDVTTDSSSNKTIVGKNGYLFLSSEFDYYTKVVSLQRQQYLKEFYQSISSTYLLFVFPNKSIICKKYLTDSFSSQCNKMQAFKAIINNNLLIYKPNNFESTDFYKTDSHMNLKGCIKMYNIFLEVLKQRLGIRLNRVEIRLKETNRINLSSLEKGLGDLTWELNQEVASSDDTYYSSLEIGRMYDESRSSLRFLNNEGQVDLSKVTYQKNNSGNHRVVIFHDSFLVSTLPLYLNLFKEVYLVNSLLSKDIIQFIQPDFVFEFRNERFLFE